MLTIIAVAVGLFFAMNIGASGAAASMGISYGSGVIKKPIIALSLCGIAVFLGAFSLPLPQRSYKPYRLYSLPAKSFQTNTPSSHVM